MNATDIGYLTGKVVLVCSAQDHRNPPTGRRGTIFVHQQSDGTSAVDIEVDFPEMFTMRAHRRRIRLTDDQVAELLASEHYGAYTVTLSDRLDPEAPPGVE